MADAMTPENKKLAAQMQRIGSIDKPKPKGTPSYSISGGGVGGSPVQVSKNNADKFEDVSQGWIDTTETKSDYNQTIQKIKAAGRKYSIDSSIVNQKIAAFNKMYTPPKSNTGKK